MYLFLGYFKTIFIFFPDLYEVSTFADVVVTVALNWLYTPNLFLSLAALFFAMLLFNNEKSRVENIDPPLSAA